MSPLSSVFRKPSALPGVMTSAESSRLKVTAARSLEINTPPPIFPMIEVNEEDFNPRDPLVRCTVLETHTHCIREAS